MYIFAKINQPLCPSSKCMASESQRECRQCRGRRCRILAGPEIAVHPIRQCEFCAKVHCYSLHHHRFAPCRRPNCPDKRAPARMRLIVANRALLHPRCSALPLAAAYFAKIALLFGFQPFSAGIAAKFTYIRICFGLKSGRLGRNKYSICQNSRQQQQLYDVRVCMCGGGGAAAAVGGQCNCEFAKCIGLNRQGHEEGARERQQRGAIHKYLPPPSRARAFITLKNKSDSAMSQGTIMSVSINNGSFQL